MAKEKTHPLCLRLPISMHERLIVEGEKTLSSKARIIKLALREYFSRVDNRVNERGVRRHA